MLRQAGKLSELIRSRAPLAQLPRPPVPTTPSWVGPLMGIVGGSSPYSPPYTAP
jgi:hypothetical protein